MPLALTVDQVATLAPDPAALAAGKKLATSRVWKDAAQDGRALWGECQGSALYQVRVDLKDLAAKCSCPSRKFPCKHALGLLLLAAAQPASIKEEAAPDWVVEWLRKRGEAADKKEKKAESAADKPKDEKAQARRAEKRAERVKEGLDALLLWMSDLVRNGLGSVADQGDRLWETQAARLVDAQAPGIAARLRRLSYVPRNTADWSRRVLVDLGRIALLIEAYRRIDTLEPVLQDDVRSLIGWTLKDEDVSARGTALDDRFWVIGQRTEEDERLRVQRTWLLGLQSRRPALVLQFAVGVSPFAENLIAGTVLDARLRYWPSAYPLRALVEERRGQPEPWSGSAPGFSRFEHLLRETTAALAAQPWIERFPCVLKDVRPARRKSEWRLVDSAGRALPLATLDNWKLVALSGGHPIDVAGEWDGEELLPLAAVADGRYERLRA